MLHNIGFLPRSECTADFSLNCVRSLGRDGSEGGAVLLNDNLDCDLDEVHYAN